MRLSSRSLAALCALLSLCGLIGVSAAEATVPGWVWPIEPPDVCRGFDPPDDQYGSGHRGVDLSASPGDIVVSASGGIVTFAGLVAGVPVIVVAHGDLRSTYQPVEATAHLGQLVAAGDSIGQVTTGPFHCAGGSVHWGVLRGEIYLDPLAFVGYVRPRLLPYWDVPVGGSVAAPIRGPPEWATRSTPPATTAGSVPTGTRGVLVAASLAGGIGGAWLVLALLRRRQ